MNISTEAVWTSLMSIIAGVVLLFMGRFVSKGEKKDENEATDQREFHKSVQEELHDVRDEAAEYRTEADKYRKMYYEALDSLHEGGSVKEVLETLEKIDSRAARTELLLAQHLRDGVYLLEQGVKHDEAVIDAFARLGIDLGAVDYQTDKALGAKKLLDELEEQRKKDEEQGDR